MPHVTIEYTNNIKEESNIPFLLEKVNQSLLKHRDIIPVGGLRTRAVELKDYRIADGTEDDAFVHITLKLGSGRSDKDIKKVCDCLFDTVKEHYTVLFDHRYLALSLEVYEFTRPTYKKNNIHQRYKTK
ncbi:5-carboxymethyl-2-hydroxymuconate Delta-isomerase [Oceanobacillus sp. FSL H7-0719]|uniref:5-carboxymethyl-2-hydroxymuconate Delta-isomerase n=1 Tax=Oceanobacillus sp. FSL H7-0719 TaxID=2954507 RepID=UPI00324DA59F